MPHPSFPVRAALSALCLAGAAAVPSAPALAQGVTLYGLLDASVEHLTDVGQGGASLNRMPGLTGSVPSRIGLRGSEDLGGGLRALFTMEQGLALDAGVLNQGGRAWGARPLSACPATGAASHWGASTPCCTGPSSMRTPSARMPTVRHRWTATCPMRARTTRLRGAPALAASPSARPTAWGVMPSTRAPVPREPTAPASSRATPAPAGNGRQCSSTRPRPGASRWPSMKSVEAPARSQA